MDEIHLCDYGCGQEAKFQMTSGKWCCESFYTKCPSIKNKTKNFGSKNGSYGKPCWNIGLTKDTDERVGRISSSNTGKKNSLLHNLRISVSQTGKIVKPETGKKIGDLLRGRSAKNKGKKLSMLNFYLKNHKEFLKYEFLEEDPETNDLIVKCFICGSKYKERRDKIRYRAQMIKLGYFERGKFVCSFGCSEGYLYEGKEAFVIYSRRAWKETYNSIRDFGNKIKNIELRGKKFGYECDHKFSVIEGFNNNIDPNIIGHWKNLEIITEGENRSKSNKCSITLEQLLKDIENTKD